ncbi:TetR/AcrR family transcriptional regulator, partial [Rhizobium ruizarguesonis]
VQIGYISMQAREELAVRMKRIPEYIAIYTGEVPQQRELDRFFSRHGYRPG